MAVLTTLQQLEAVQAAITDILTNGQTYAIGGRAHTRADLGVLYKREQILLERYYRETNGRARNLARFDTPQ